MNGFLYKNEKEFFSALNELVQDKAKRVELAKNAYHTITEDWNPSLAVQRFISFCTNKLVDKEVRFDSGPMSKA